MKLEDLYNTILDRKTRMPEGSYVVSLLRQDDFILQKIGEEATELVIAGKNKSLVRLKEEAADLFFHILVLLAAKGINPEDIYLELEKRRVY